MLFSAGDRTLISVANDKGHGAYRGITNKPWTLSAILDTTYTFWVTSLTTSHE